MKRHIFLFIACVLGSLMMPLHAQMQWKNPLHESFPTVQGRWWHEELKDSYHRFPDRFESTLPKAVWSHSLQTAGLSIQFRTMSPTIEVRYTIGSGLPQMQHWAFTGCGGVDLYATDKHGRQRWCAARITRGDTIRAVYSDLVYPDANPRYGYEFELFLPMFVEVTNLEVGVPEGQTLTFLPVTQEAPIVFYGTSIAHGGCASRPGMAWVNMIRREMQHPVVSLGFSGSGRLEASVFDALAEIRAKVFVIDCMPNMSGRTDIVALVTDGVKKLRRQSAAPILLVEHAGYTNESTNDKVRETYEATNRQLREAYDGLQAAGVRDLYYLPHSEFFLSQDETVDGTHPNDLGMRHQADAYEKKLREVMHQLPANHTIFHPIPQQRDQYDWRARHEEELRMGREGDVDVVMIGNSITHFWSGLPQDKWHRGDDSWTELFGSRRVMNMGFGWDRIENILWRLYHGELDGFRARKIAMMLGTNNYKINTPEEIVTGVVQVVSAVRRRQPEAELYVQGIYPRRGAEQDMAELNRNLEARLRQTFGDAVRFINPGEVLLGKDGKVDESLFTGDGLHPCDKGYRLLGKHLKQDLGL